MSVTDALAPELADGTFLLEAALARGWDVELFPRQVMTCWDPSRPEVRRSFVHGIPDTSTLAGVTYAQDKRVVRALLQRHGVTSTRGATFSFRGRNAAMRYAGRQGYPVTVRMAIDDSIRTPPRIATGPSELEAVLDDLRRIRDDSLASASNLRRSAYSLTGLLEPEQAEDGGRLFAAATRVLIERVPEVPRIHVLILGGEPIAAVEVPPGAGSSEPEDITTNLDTRHREAALRAAAAVPGLNVAHVVLLPQEPRRFPRKAPYLIHDVSERLGLDLFHRVAPGWASDLASRLLDAALGDNQEPVRDGQITIDARFEGASGPDSFAEALGEGAVLGADPIRGHVSTVITGRPEAIARSLTEISTFGFSEAHAIFAQVSVTDGP